MNKETAEPRVTREIALVSLAIFFADASHSTVIPIFPGFAQRLGASLGVLGSYGSVAALTMLLLSLPLGRYSDRFGRKKMMIPGLVLFILVPLGYMLASSPIHLYPIRIFLGLAVGLIFGNGFLLMTELSREENRSIAQGLYMTSMGIGFTIGPLIGGFTAKLFSPTTSFLISAGLGAMSLLTLLFVKEASIERKEGNQPEKITLSSVFMDRQILAAGVANYLNSLMFNALTLFFPVYGANVGFDESEIGSSFTARGLASTVVRLPVGALTQRIRALYLMVFGLVLSALMIFSLSTSVILMAVTVFMGIQGIAYGIYLTSGNVYVAVNSDEDYRGTAMALYSMFGNFSGIINPLVLGLIAENLGSQRTLQFASVFTLLGVGLVYSLGRKK